MRTNKKYRFNATRKGREQNKKQEQQKNERKQKVKTKKDADTSGKRQAASGKLQGIT